jgi:hypothetical protein
MPRRSAKTAAEFVAQLQNDPEYQALRKSQDAELAKKSAICAADERGLVGELRGLGYDIDSVYDLVNNSPHPILARRFLGPYPAAYPVLIQHLKTQHEPAIREGIIRALTVRDGGRPVEEALLEEFDREKNAHLRWVLANALKTAMPYSRRRKRPDIAAVFQRAGA